MLAASRSPLKQWRPSDVGEKFASGLTAYRSEFELLVATTINGPEADIANCGPVCAIGQC
jgi:hypothetical protein